MVDKQVDKKPGQKVTVCINCTYTCHEECYFQNNDEKKGCGAMNDEGNCNFCP